MSKQTEKQQENMNNAAWWVAFVGANMVSVTLMAMLLV